MEDKQTGLIHVYCGDGKGKTTAAMGLAMRCAGAGEKVLIFQFLKDNTSSERRTLSGVDGIIVPEGKADIKFSFRMTAEEKRETADYYASRFLEIRRMLTGERFGLVVLDEVFSAINLGFLDESAVLAFLRDKPRALEVVLTGREPGEAFLVLADYVTEMKKIKHPYDRGITARRGIEY